MSKRNPNSFRPELTQLENREVPSVASVQLAGGVLTVTCDNVGSNVIVNQYSGTTYVRDVLTNHVWAFNSASVNRVDVFGGAGNDNLIAKTNTPNVARLVRLFGGDGNDHLTGMAGPVSMTAGSGTDVLVAKTGNDTLVGGSGSDTLQGGTGNDSLVAGTGNDYLNGGGGTNTLRGGIGNDVIVAINNSTADTIITGIGTATIWVDSNGGVTDTISGSTANDVIQAVTAFANAGATRSSPNSGSITEPQTLPGDQLEAFNNRPLFATGGPTPADVKQYVNPMGGGVGGTGTALDDSWLLAGLGAIAQQNPAAIERNVVDLGDGTYAVKLGNNFYRVDNKLPVSQYGNTFAAYASLGLENSLWVPIVEKAFTYLETPVGTPKYSSLAVATNKLTTNVFLAFEGTNVGSTALNGATGFANATALGQAIQALMDSGYSCAIGVTTGAAGATLINGREYSIISYDLDINGNVSDVVLRNPMGVDGGGSADNDPNDGLITVTIANLFATKGTLDYGAV